MAPSPTPTPPPKLSSSNSSSSLSDHFPNLRQFFTRSASQPSQQLQPQPTNDAPAHVRSSSISSTSSSSCDADADAHAQAFGSCTQVLATAITALFRAINSSGVYKQERADSSTTRSAKLLYVQLLDRAQRERGEWRGFADTSSSSSSSTASGDGSAQKKTTSANGILATHLHNLSRDEMFALLNELVDVSFRSIRGPLVGAEVYARHKKPLAALSLGIPVSLPALLEIRAILNELGRDEKLCVFRLLTLWHAMAVANEAQDLRRTIQEKHHLVFSDCTELEFLTTLRDPRHDAVAIALLHILVLYHDVLFSDVEFLLIKQELQLSDSLRRTRVVSAEPSESPDATFSKSIASLPADTAAQMEASSPPLMASQVEQLEHLDTTKERNGADFKEYSAAEPEVVVASSFLDQASLPSEAPPVAVAAEAAPCLPESQSETQSAACEDKYATPEHATAEAESRQAPAELSSQQQKPGELSAAPSQADAATTVSSALVHSNASTEHQVHGQARAHGPMVSIRPHSLSPRKIKPSKRFVFESLSVNTASPSAKHPHQQHHNPSPKSNGAREATSLWSDVVHIADYFGGSSASEKQQQDTQVNGVDSKRPAQLLLDISATAVAVVRRVEQHSPVTLPSKASLVDLPATRASSGREATPDLHPQEQKQDNQVSRIDGCCDKRMSPSARHCSSSSAKPSPPLHEITDLANTYFSFSFAAATLRTMAIMAVYAIRRHQHQQQ